MTVVAASISTTVVHYSVKTIKDMESPYPLNISESKMTLLQQYYYNYTYSPLLSLTLSSLYSNRTRMF